MFTSSLLKIDRLERVEKSMSNADLKKCFTTMRDKEAKASISREINRRERNRKRRG